MPPAPQVAPHLTPDQLLDRLRACSDANQHERMHAVLLKLEGRSTKEVASIFKRRADWVRTTVRAYNAGGPDALRDGRQNNGKKPMLDEEGQQALREALLRPPTDGGL